MGGQGSSPYKSVRRRACPVLRRRVFCGVSLSAWWGYPSGPGPESLSPSHGDEGRLACLGTAPVLAPSAWAKARAGGVEGGDQRRGRARQPVPWSGRAALPPCAALATPPPPAVRRVRVHSSLPPPPAPLLPQSAESGEPGGGKVRRGLGGRKGTPGRPLCVGAGRPTTAGPRGRRESEGGGEPCRGAPSDPQPRRRPALALRRP